MAQLFTPAPIINDMVYHIKAVRVLIKDIVYQKHPLDVPLFFI